MRHLTKLLLLICGCLISWASFASTYPLTVTDMAGRKVTIQSEPQRVVLQDGRDLMMLALLDRQNPFKRVVAWNNLIKRHDRGTWKPLVKQWPAGNKILDMNFGDSGNLNIEEVITHRPQLLIAELRAKPALEQSGVIKKLAKVNVPVVFVDTGVHPVINAPKSVALLGKILNKQANAKAYVDFYESHLAKVKQLAQQAIKDNGGKRTSVFLEAHAGAKGANDCCFTHNHFGWGPQISAAGGENVGGELLKGPTGVVSMEKVLQMQPDVYVMSGADFGPNSLALPLGGVVSAKRVHKAFDRLLSRPGFKQLKAYKNHRIYGIYHQFYNHAYNIVSIEGLAKDFYPKAFKGMDPTQTYHTILNRFTDIKIGNVTLFAHAQYK